MFHTSPKLTSGPPRITSPGRAFPVNLTPNRPTSGWPVNWNPNPDAPAGERYGLLSPIWACVAELFVALTRTLLQEEPSMAARYPIWLLVGVPTAVFGLAVASTVVPQVVHAVVSEVVRAVVKGLVG